MDSVPDMDALLDQLEASESADGGTKTSETQSVAAATKSCDFSNVKPLSSSSSFIGTIISTVCSQFPKNSTAGKNSFAENEPLERPIEGSSTVNKRSTAEVSSRVVDSVVDLIDLDPLNNYSVNSYNNYADNKFSDEVVHTVSVLEEIFCSVNNGVSENNLGQIMPSKEKSDDLLTLVPRGAASCDETALCKSGSARHTDSKHSNNLIADSVPTESDFAEMEAYLANCSELDKHLQPTESNFVSSGRNAVEEKKGCSAKAKNHSHRMRRISDKARSVIRKFSGGNEEKPEERINSFTDEKVSTDPGSGPELNEPFSECSDLEEKKVKSTEDKVSAKSKKRSGLFKKKLRSTLSGSEESANVDSSSNSISQQTAVTDTFNDSESSRKISETVSCEVSPSHGQTAGISKIDENDKAMGFNGLVKCAVKEEAVLAAKKKSLNSDLHEPNLVFEDMEKRAEGTSKDVITLESCNTVSSSNTIAYSNDGLRVCKQSHNLHNSLIENVLPVKAEEEDQMCDDSETNKEPNADAVCLDQSSNSEQVAAKGSDNSTAAMELEDVHGDERCEIVGKKADVEKEDENSVAPVCDASVIDNADEAEELREDSVIQDAGDEILEVTQSTVEGVSVIESTHDISAASTNIRLTESELQLGKVKPEWIADSEMTTCMLCCSKFTFLLRRHHCRSCGRVLCAHCTTLRAVLPYMNEPTKKFKVCEPCFQTLERIEIFEKEDKKGKKAGETGECGASTSGVDTEVTARTTKSVLKTKSINIVEEHDTVLCSSEGTKRCVKFRDGVTPGSVDAEVNIPSGADSSCHSSKPRKVRTSVSKRLKELRMEEESVCFLPKDCSGALYYRNDYGGIAKYESIDMILTSFTAGEVVVIAITRNLWCRIKLCELSCCRLGKVVCVTSSGMAAVGLDEILIAYDFHDSDDFSVPLEVARRVYEIYRNSLKPEVGSQYGKIGIREVHLRVPFFNSSENSSEEGFMFRDLLLFRPSVQCFENLIIPSCPFLVGSFLHHSESVWAMAIPQRLLYRIGLQASYYPTPIVNKRSRDAVYSNITHTTVLKVFCDFKNWAYRMPVMYGSAVSLCDNETRLLIPKFGKEEVKKLVNCNKDMIAWVLDFNSKADSHLVCEQDEYAVYKTQVFTSGNSVRKVTGASFIVIDGALKGSDVPVSVNVVEDGITVRLQPDSMTKVLEALCAGVDCKVESSNTNFFIEWKDIEPRGYPGELVSSVDHMSLMGKFQYGLSEERILSSLYVIPGVSDWALRLVGVYNCENGRFSSSLRSKIFAVAEQIAAQIPCTITPFINSLIKRDLRHLYIRIHITPEEAEYTAASWYGLEAEFGTWTELLDNQLVPGLFNVCSYISVGFKAEICLALISTCSLP